MEATKKKKAYLKPEMSRFEVKTQEFIAGSKEIIEIPPTTEDNEIIDFTSALGPECTKGGTYSQIAAGGCETFKINSLQKEDKCSIWPILIKKWPELTEGSTVCICHRIINGESHYYASKDACTFLQFNNSKFIFSIISISTSREQSVSFPPCYFFIPMLK